jgi:hypothetical protein
LVQTDEERKEKDRIRRQTPEYKAKAKEAHRKYYLKNKTRLSSISKTRERTSEYKEKQKEYQKKYRQSAEGKLKAKIRRQNPEYKAKQKQRLVEYHTKPENQMKVTKKRIETKEKIKKEVFSHYSKLHSNSNIPCCRCCGENSHMDFLTVDHIDGRKNRPEKEQKLVGLALNRWLKKNNYPEGFQILCFNCNSTKGFFGSCPHERMRKEETFAMMEEQSSFEAGF